MMSMRLLVSEKKKKINYLRYHFVLLLICKNHIPTYGQVQQYPETRSGLIIVRLGIE